MAVDQDFVAEKGEAAAVNLSVFKGFPSFAASLSVLLYCC